MDHTAVGARLAVVRERIAASHPRGEVTLVAVSKGFGADAVEAVVAAGVTDVGESRAQELVAKSSGLLAPHLHWHFIGRLQTNKVRALAGTVALWQSVDRPGLVDELARWAAGARVLVQVNVSGAPGQGGCRPDQAADLVGHARSAGLEVLGLMAIGAARSPEEAREGFRLLTRLADDLRLPVRSIGMSGDLETAVEEGSTMVRVGRALLGSRPGGGGGPPADARQLRHYRQA